MHQRSAKKIITYSFLLQSEDTVLDMETTIEPDPPEIIRVQEAESTTSTVQSETSEQKTPQDAAPQATADESVAKIKEPTPEPEEPPSPPKPKIQITIKTPKEKQIIEVDEDACIKDIKTIASEKFSADPDYLCLIFAGKMMEDNDTLETHNIHEGMTIHLIIKTAPREAEPGPQRPPADIQQTPFGLGSIGGLVGLESLGLGSANFMELQNRLQTELLGNPELLRRVLENPLVQSLMNETDSMKSLLQNIPQMRDLMSRHPEIRSMLNNTELLKHTSELARNPSMLQELMRNLDGSNPMDGTTTYTTLPTIYNNFQEPHLSSVTAKVQEALKKTEPGNIFNNPQMSSLLQQMAENPQTIQNMLSAPYTQTMLQALQADPSMTSAIVNENPLYKNNPQLQQYIQSMMPQLITQLQNPEVLNMMANPQAVNALMNIQEGLDQLKNVAPGLVTNLGLGSFNDYTGANNPGNSSADASAAAEKKTTPQQETFSKFMAAMVSQMASSDSGLPPEQRYKLQMDHLKMMGFQNEELNLQVLTSVFGDVNAAVLKLFARNNTVQ